MASINKYLLTNLLAFLCLCLNAQGLSKGDIEIKVEFKEQEKEEPTEDEPNEEIIIDTETPITVDRILTYITLFLISLMVFVNIVLYKKRKA